MAEYKNITELDDLNRRLGEALTSGGAITLVHAKTDYEIQALQKLGFKQVGTFVDDNGNLVILYNVQLKEKEVVKIVEVPTTPLPDWWKNNKTPFSPPYHQPLWCNGGSSGDADWKYNTLNISTNIGSSTSLMDEAYNPLSILEDYLFPQTEKARNI